MKKILISDKHWIKPLLEQIRPSLSEYSFANLFLFQPTHWYEWFEHNEHRFIKGLSYTSEWFLMPLFRPQESNLKLIREAFELSQASYIYPIDEESKQIFTPQEWKFASFISESDYIYSTESIRTYSGRALDGRRNLVHKFLDHAKIRTESITTNSLLDAEKTILNWYHEMKTAEHEVTACLSALKNWKELDLSGRITYVDEKPSGIAIGEQLNQNTYLVHFAKANSSEKGIYQYIYQDLARAIPNDLIYLNWEQDLGIDGLRNAKEAYKPLSHYVKWRISPASNGNTKH